MKVSGEDQQRSVCATRAIKRAIRVKNLECVPRQRRFEEVEGSRRIDRTSIVIRVRRCLRTISSRADVESEMSSKFVEHYSLRILRFIIDMQYRTKRAENILSLRQSRMGTPQDLPAASSTCELKVP